MQTVEAVSTLYQYNLKDETLQIKNTLVLILKTNPPSVTNVYFVGILTV